MKKNGILKLVILMKGEAVRQKLITVTRTLLKTNPVVTVKEIADASYLNVASIKYYFGSKDKLLNVVCEQFVDEIKEGMVQVADLNKLDTDFRLLFDETIRFIKGKITENYGVMYYLLGKIGTETGDILLEAFFSSTEFATKLIDVIQLTTKIQERKRVEVIYTMIFASIIFPLRFKTKSLKYPEYAEFGKSEQFNNLLIEEIYKLITNKSENI